MTSGPTLFMVLSAENAVENWRGAIGPTDPTQAKEQAPESIRAQFGSDVKANAVHAPTTESEAQLVIKEVFGDLKTKTDGTVDADTKKEASEMKDGVEVQSAETKEEKPAEATEAAPEAAADSAGEAPEAAPASEQPAADAAPPAEEQSPAAEEKPATPAAEPAAEAPAAEPSADTRC